MQRQASAIQQVVTLAVIFCYAFPQSDNTFHCTWFKLPDSSYHFWCCYCRAESAWSGATVVVWLVTTPLCTCITYQILKWLLPAPLCGKFYFPLMKNRKPKIRGRKQLGKEGRSGVILTPAAVASHENSPRVCTWKTTGLTARNCSVTPARRSTATGALEKTAAAATQ